MKYGLAAIVLGVTLAGCSSGGGGNSITGGLGGEFRFTPAIASNGIMVTVNPINISPASVQATATNNQNGATSGSVALGDNGANIFSGVTPVPIILTDTYNVHVVGFDATGNILASQDFTVIPSQTPGATTTGGGSGSGSGSGSGTGTGSGSGSGSGTGTPQIPPVPGPPPFPSS